MLAVQLIWAVPLIGAGVAASLFPTTVETTTTDDLQLSEVLSPLLIVLAFVGLTLVLSLIAQLATLHIVAQQALTGRVSVAEAFMAGLKRAPAMLGWGVLMVLMIGVGLLLCVIPGIYVAIAMTALPAVVLLERGNAIGRGFQLFHANFSSSIARVGIILAIGVGFSLVDNAFASALGAGPLATVEISTGTSVITAVVTTLITLVSTVVVSPMVLTAYADMRARHEPFSAAYLSDQFTR